MQNLKGMYESSFIGVSGWLGTQAKKSPSGEGEGVCNGYFWNNTNNEQ